MIIEKTLPLILIFLLGFFLKKIGILKKEHSTVLSKLLLYLVIPSMLIKVFAEATLERSLIHLPLIGLVTICFLFILGYFFSRFLKNKKTQAAFLTAFPTFQGGSIGYPFMLAAFGASGLSKIVLFDLANAFFVCFVICFISYYLGGGVITLKESIARFLKLPLIWAILIGVLFNIIGFHNTLLFNLFETIGGSLLFLSMLFIGLEFQPSISSLKLPSITIILKTAAGFLLGWGFALLFGLTGLERIALIVWASIAPSFIVLIFTKENDLDIEFTANLLSIGYPFSIIFTFLLVNLL